MQWVEDRLRELADKDGQYREFNARVVATADPATMLGVRVPKLRRLAREVSRSGDRDAFLGELPHRWYEEYLVHAFALNETREVEPAVRLLDALLPFVDNWCVCDALNPRAFHDEKALNGRQREALLPLAQRWMGSEHTYTRRFGVSMLMRDLLGKGYDPSQLRMAIAADNGEYYVRMMIAWYLAEALVPHEDDALAAIASPELDPQLRRMAIRKGIESLRVPAETKDALCRLRG
ncbi:DNA alkylation repair protein [Olsenella sp. kh2p3]|jgi:3-methyladenine DNA glycosylase AlkD|uniref:DNA alkylation repair protein n=1 Tax=Olsenella sp. kh2p3 TaxID=1797112 RepID=UPI00091B5068|nr:DNA alkylation repair protein [Olsenella sp. kh2p3]SFX38323.1 3-methyladenine DNA glycosylase AlkD [Olsenella sp. kh2p3]